MLMRSPHLRRYCKECGNVTQLQPRASVKNSLFHSIALVVLTAAFTSSLLVAILGRD